MKVVILAGGYGTRINHRINGVPKPMLKIGTKPLLWHIMKIYAAQGFKDFIILAGYKGEVIKHYFENEKNNREKWRIKVIDTGEHTMTGGRIRQAKSYIGQNTFLMTYGDGVSDLNIHNLVDFHKRQKVLVTLTAVLKPEQFGRFLLKEDQTKIKEFHEKPLDDAIRINGGFFVLEPKIFSYIKDDMTIWEQGPLQQLASEFQLAGYRHDGFWHCIDTPQDRKKLQEMWRQNTAPWKIW